MLHTGPIDTPVLSAIDMACWDIVGKALGETVYNLLGGLFHNKLRAYTYLYGWKMGDPPEKAADDILRYIDRGFTAVKLDPVGGLEPHRLETLTYVEGVIKAMREAAGDRCDILIGTHGQLTTHAAIRLAKRLEPYEPLWFEEPVAPDNIDEMTRYEFLPLLQKQAASIIQMDLSITGGISEARKIATMAETHYAHIAPHVWGGPFAAAAAIHVDVCSPNFLIQEGIETFSEFHRDILTEPIVWQDGCIIPPTAPGLGYELDEARMPPPRRAGLAALAAGACLDRCTALTHIHSPWRMISTAACAPPKSPHTPQPKRRGSSDDRYRRYGPGRAARATPPAPETGSRHPSYRLIHHICRFETWSSYMCCRRFAHSTPCRSRTYGAPSLISGTAHKPIILLPTVICSLTAPTCLSKKQASTSTSAEPANSK